MREAPFDNLDKIKVNVFEPENELRDLRLQLDIAVAALEFYASGTYKVHDIEIIPDGFMNFTVRKPGLVAREALSQILYLQEKIKEIS